MNQTGQAVGVIGLGIMGGAISRNLAAKGWHVAGFDTDPDRCNAARENGVEIAANTAEVATKADVSGPLDSPQTSTWQVLVRLVQNAFIKAILPGFEREAAASSRSKGE